MKDRFSNGERQVGVPDRARDHQAAPREKGSYDLEHFLVPGPGQITFPEQVEQFFEVAFEPSGALEREKEVIDGHGGYIVRGLAPFPARAVQYGEVQAVPEEDVPRVEVTVH